MSTIEDLKTAVTTGRRKDARLITTTLLNEGIAPEVLLEEGLIPAMSIVGEKFKRNEVFVPEMLVSARAMKESMKLIEPKLLEKGIKPEFKAVIGTVEGDLHDIGKNLVATMWKGAGFDVVDMGVNVSPANFAAAVKEHAPDIVGLSALLTTTMPAMQAIVSAVRETGSGVKVVIGGAPVTQEYADQIGADGYAPDAASAVDLARAILTK